MPVYFIRVGHDGPVKIGFASNAVRRLKTLQTGHFATLFLVAVIENGSTVAELDLHNRFFRHRIRGEWFAPHAEILSAIRKHAIEPVSFDEDVVVNHCETVANDSGAGSQMSELREWIIRCGLSLRQLTQLAGLPEWSLRRWKQPNWRPSADTISKLESVRRLRAGAGPLPLPDLDESAREAGL